MTSEFAVECLDCGLSVHDARWVDYVADSDCPVKIEGGEGLCLQCFGLRVRSANRGVFIAAGLPVVDGPVTSRYQPTVRRAEIREKIIEGVLAFRRQSRLSESMEEAYRVVSEHQKVSSRTIKRWVATYQHVPDHRLGEGVARQSVAANRPPTDAYVGLTAAVKAVLARSPLKSAPEVLEEISKRAEFKVSARTVQRIIHRLRG